MVQETRDRDESSRANPGSDESELNEFMERVRVSGEGVPFTHVTKEGPKGKYYITGAAIDEFFNVYCKAVQSGYVPTIAESPLQNRQGLLRVDVDFKADPCLISRQYTRRHVRTLVKMYQEEIKQSIPDYAFENTYLQCILFEKKAPRFDNENNCIKDGFHILFPFLTCDEWFQDNFLRSQITIRMKKQGLWDDCKFTTSIEKIIDDHMASKPWLMYGSAKTHHSEPFLVTRCYDENAAPVTLARFFDLQMLDREESVKFYLPRFLSIRERTELVPLVDKLAKIRLVHARGKKKKRPIPKRPMEDVLKDLAIIQNAEILDMLSDERADDYHQWTDIGWTLYNLGQGCDQALRMFIDFSRRSSKFAEGVCEDFWETKCELRNYDAKEKLLRYARYDSPNRFKEYYLSDIKQLIYDTFKRGKHTDERVARVVHALYKDRFLCAKGGRDSIWFEFRNHRWFQLDNAVRLLEMFPTEVSQLYENYRSELDMSTKDNVGDRDFNQRRIKEVDALLSDLEQTPFRERLLKTCTIKFYNGNFFKDMDEDRYIFVCDNGVLDLKQKVFREGRQEDWATFSCGVEYPTQFRGDEYEIEQVEDYLKKIFPNYDRKNYFIKLISSCLEGGNKNKTFVIHTGESHAGKSINFHFLKKVFGDYLCSFPNNGLYKGDKNSSGAARPELARVRGKRIVVASEIPKDQTLDIEAIKKYTGGDDMYVRNLYEKGSDIKLGFVLMIQCNELPRIPGNDEPAWGRTRVLDYEAKFVLPKDEERFPIPDTEEEQFSLKRFKADPYMEDKLDSMAPGFLWLLFDTYKKYGKTIKEPSVVLASTNYWRQLNDIYTAFKEENLEYIQEPNVSLDLVVLFPAFIEWYRQNHSGFSRDHRPTRLQVKHEFDKILAIKSVQKGRTWVWTGIRIKQYIEDKNDDFCKLTYIPPKEVHI